MNLIEKAESTMNQAVLEAGIRNIRTIIPEQHRADYDKALLEFLPKIKEFLKEKLDTLNKKLGESDESKKFYLLHNITGVPEIWEYPKKDLVALDGVVTMEYSLETLVKKIDGYQKAEDLIIDLLTMKLFDLTQKKEITSAQIENK